jgi:hypothetical protein
MDSTASSAVRVQDYFYVEHKVVDLDGGDRSTGTTDVGLPKGAHVAFRIETVGF